MHLTNHAVSNRGDLRERTKTMSRHGDRRGQISNFRDSFETINWLYLLFKCGIKTKTPFEWLLWHWSSLGQLNFEPTRPNGLVGCKLPTDLVKISVKEATHMGFCYIVPWILMWLIQSGLLYWGDMIWLWYGQFSPGYTQKTPHGSPKRVRYGGCLLWVQLLICDCFMTCF